MFAQVLGGKVGAESLLTVTGNSVIGDIRTDVCDLRKTNSDIQSKISTVQLASCAMQSEVTQLRVSLTAIERALSSSSPAIQIALSSGQSDGMAPPVAPISSTELASMQHHLSIIHEELIGVKRRLESDAAVTFSSGQTEAMPRRCVPVFYLSNSFKLSSCQPFTLLLRWVTAEPPAPAWRHIRNEMLPRTDGRRAQECLLTIYNGFMHALLGRNPNFSVVESNVRGIFDLAWNRMASACQWEPFRLPDRSVKTVYGWLRDRPAAMKILQDTKLILPDTFELQLALRQRDARDTSRNGQSAASNVGHSAIHLLVPPYTTMSRAHRSVLSDGA